MKTTLKLTTLLLGLALVFGTSCGKYEEGPAISLLSKESRVANTWIIDKYETADGDVTQENNSPTLELTKNGAVTYTNNDGNLSYTGSWEFVDNKEKIKMTYSSGNFSVTSTATIIQLKSKEMILADEDGDKTYYVQK